MLSSAVGHLLEIGMPEDEEVKRGKWTFAHLPAIPSQFALKPIEKNEARLQDAAAGSSSARTSTALINACDAGREGELIFRYIVQYAKTDKPIERLWLQSMTPASIRDGFERLRSDQAMRPLADAAVCRSESDWLVGINGTRAMTAFNSKSGGFQLTTVGRVQTPTLAILVEREEKIRAFVPRDYWELIGTFRAEAGEYTGRWFDEKFRKRDGATTTDRSTMPIARRAAVGRSGRARDRATLRRQAGHRHRGGEADDADRAAALRPHEPAARSERPLRLFRAHDAVARAGAVRKAQGADVSAHRFARAARGLPRHRQGDARGARATRTPTARHARTILKHKWVRPNKRIFDNSKISDHFAIIPTLVRPKHLNEVEAKLYDLVVKRFLAVFHPAAEFLVTTRITRVGGAAVQVRRQGAGAARAGSPCTARMPPATSRR